MLRLPRVPGVVPLDSVAVPALTGLASYGRAAREIKRQNVFRDGGDRGRATQFEQLVADALDSIPPELGDAMDNVVVVVEEWPTPEQLGGRHGMLLGLYEGVPLTSRGPLSYAGVAPDRITVFSGSICRLAHDEEELASQRARRPCCTKWATTSA